MRSRSRVMAVVFAVAAVGALVAGCSSEPAVSSSASGSGRSLAGQSITVYSGQHAQTVQGLAKDFEQRTGVHVNLRSGDEAELAGQLLQEGSSSPADVFYAENPPALTTLAQKGLLAPVDKQTLAAVPRDVSWPSSSITRTVPDDVIFLPAADCAFRDRSAGAGSSEVPDRTSVAVLNAQERASGMCLVGVSSTRHPCPQDSDRLSGQAGVPMPQFSIT